VENDVLKQKQIILGIALTIFSIIFSFGLLELGVRVVEFVVNPPKAKVMKPRPQFPERPQRYYLPTTSSSLRGNTSEIEKSKDTFRISVVGDSFTFAPKMQFFDSFPFRLETLLKTNPNAKKIEVRSYGTPGASTKDEVSLVENAIKAKSDLIILEITLNDPQLEPFRKTPPDFDPSKTDSRIRKVLFYSALFRFVSKRVYNYQSYQRYIDYHNELFQQPETKQNFEKSIQRINTLAKESGIPLVAVVLPLFDFEFNNYPFEAIHKQIAELLKSENIMMLDLLPRFKGTDNARLQVVPSIDNHPNEIAHRIIAEGIYEFLIRKKLISDDYSGLYFGYREAVFQREKPRRLHPKK
jgi:lysophospholipase L1-like esterase